MQDGINDLSKQTGVTTERATTDHFEGFDPSRTEVEQNVTVYDDFVTTGEESALLREIEPRFKRLRCESSHWMMLVEAVPSLSYRCLFFPLNDSGE